MASNINHIESDFSAQLDFDEMDSSGDILEIVGETINHYETNMVQAIARVHYSVWYNRILLGHPNVINNQLYALQPFFNLKVFLRFYTGQIISKLITSLDGFYGFIVQDFTLASVDLTVLEWMVDNLAMMGQGMGIQQPISLQTC